MTDPKLTYYTLTSGTVVGLVEPEVSDVELSLKQVPGGTPALAAMTIQRTNLARLLVRKVGGASVGYEDLRAKGLERYFPGAKGVRDLDQVRLIVDTMTATTALEDASVLKSARPTEAVDEPDEPAEATAGK